MGAHLKYIGFENDNVRVTGYDCARQVYQLQCKHCLGPHEIKSSSAWVIKVLRSCGCVSYGHNRLPPGEAAFNRLFSGLKNNAAIRKINWGLSAEETRKLVTAPCYYCGSEPTQKCQPKTTNGGFAYNGIDRLDSRGHYTADNVVSCCKHCNTAKNVMPVADFYRWVKRVADHLKATKRLPSKRSLRKPAGEAVTGSPGPNTVVYMVAGVSGSGKSALCESVAKTTPVYRLEYDKIRRYELGLKLVEASKQPLPILLDIMTMVSTTIRRNLQFTFKLYCIVETEDVIRERLARRGGTFTPAVARRMKRILRLASDAHAAGTYDQIQSALLADLQNSARS